MDVARRDRAREFERGPGHFVHCREVARDGGAEHLRTGSGG